MHGLLLQCVCVRVSACCVCLHAVVCVLCVSCAIAMNIIMDVR